MTLPVEVDTTPIRGAWLADGFGGPTRVTKLDGGPVWTAPVVVVGCGVVVGAVLGGTTCGAGLVTGGCGWFTVGVAPRPYRPRPIPTPAASSTPLTDSAATRR